MRIDLVHIYPIVFPDRYDEKGQRLCRWCGKPVLNRITRKGRVWYCDDHCAAQTYKALSWEEASREAFKRDGGKCRICGTNLEYDQRFNSYKLGWETHHIIPPDTLRQLAWEVTREIPDEKEQDRWFQRLYAMLYLDVNNLKTLCVKCHDIVHSADNRHKEIEDCFVLAPTKWLGFWRLCEIGKTQMTLDQLNH